MYFEYTILHSLLHNVISLLLFIKGDKLAKNLGKISVRSVMKIKVWQNFVCCTICLKVGVVKFVV